MLFADQDAIYKATTKKLILPRIYNEQSKFNRKGTVICHFCKRLLWRPYPHTENYKQWHIKEVHEVLKCHTFDDDLKEYITKNEDKYIDKLYNAEVDELWKEHCDGSISAWEMSTLGFYYHEHELNGVRYDDMKFENYYDMPELPVIEKYIEYKGREIPMYKIRFIVGTVLDKNSYKHTITLLTPNGVVNVKCTGDHYSKYDKQLSQFNPETKRKEVIEKSWFKRGTKLIVAGYRNQDQFMARSRAKDKIYPFYRILDVDDTGQLNVTRYRCDDD